MTLGAFITITNPKQRGDTFDECYKMARELCDEVAVIDGSKTWPKYFSWPLIGEHFQKGYEALNNDWVLHLDCDFIFHEKDMGKLRDLLNQNYHSPAVSFYKYQFILPDRYNLKSRLALAVNKRKYGNRIRFNGGGDLCQPTIDNNILYINQIPESGLPFYNYEKIIKTKEQIIDDVTRMDKAWHQHFGTWLYSDNGKDAYNGWYRMASGRFNKPQEIIKLSEHPKYMQGTIANLKPDQWGYSGFGMEVNKYA